MEVQFLLGVPIGISNVKFQMSNSASDEELVAQVLKRDKEALGELFRRYHKPFFNLAYRFLGDYYLADDLTSEIFLRIYKYLKSYNLNQRFKPWAFKVATNACLTFKNQKYNLKIKNEDTDGEQNGLETISDDKVDLVHEVVQNEMEERVQKALQKLPEKYRLALYLYYFEDLKYEEISEDMGIPINTVRTHIKRGKERLKEELRDLI